MAEVKERSKKSLLHMELSTFNIPPSGEILVLGKRSAIGAQAGKKMLDTVAPHQFELIEPDDELIDGILIKKQLLLMADKDSLLRAIIEESKLIMSEEGMITIKCKIAVTVNRELYA